MTRRTSWRRRAHAPAALVAVAVIAAVGTPAAATPLEDPVAVRLLALNDFHGNLEPPTGSSGMISGRPAGGVEHLATQLETLRSEVDRENTITVAAGDLIGASPLLSAAFHDEPTIESLGLAGLDYASVGNHEFDEGAAELIRIQEGGCHPDDGCADPATPYAGAGFRYLSANAFDTDDGRDAAPSLRDPRGRRGEGRLHRDDPGGHTGPCEQGGASPGSPSPMRSRLPTRTRRQLQDEDVEAIVVLLHEGGFQAAGPGAESGDQRLCESPGSDRPHRRGHG